MKRRNIIILSVLLGALVAIVAGKFIWDYRVFRAIRRSDFRQPLNVRTISSNNRTNYVREEFTFEGCPGEEVPVLGLIPVGATNRSPAIIFLYGIGMKMNFADRPEIGEAVSQAGFAMFVPEQFDRGKRSRKTANRFQDIVALRHRIVLTISETRRLADAIAKRTDVDPRRIYLWGASFGAMNGCLAMAYDQRFSAGVFTLSAGDLQKIVADSPYCESLPRFSWIRAVAPIAASFLRPFDPIYHVGLIAPRPLLFQNARNDDLLPRSAVEALYQAAGEPKQIIWYDSPHDRLERATIENLVGDALTWLKKRDREIVAAGKIE